MSELIALDLGGVIVDVDHDFVERRLGIDRPSLERAFFDGGLHDDVTVGRVAGEAFCREAARRLDKPVDAVRAAWSELVNVTADGHALVVSLLARGHRVHLWSNTDPLHLARMASQLPSGVVVATASFHLGAMKPHREYFERALALGKPCVFLDDLAKNVDGALAAGVDARLCNGPRAARAILRALSLV